MMKMDKMPTIMALLVFSWLIAIFGLATGIYLIVLRSGEIKSLLIAFSILLGSLILAAVIRTFGNIGQMIFDLKSFIFVFYHSVSNDLRALIQSLTNLNQDLKAQLQNQTTTLSQGLNDLRALIQSLTNFNQDLKAQLQNQTTTLSQDLKELDHSLSEDLQALMQRFTLFSQHTKETKEALTQALSNLNQDLKAQLQNNSDTLMQNFQELKQNFSSALQTLQSSLELISCDSKDISQNIHQIKTFFEQIEKHLDLKR